MTPREGLRILGSELRRRPFLLLVIVALAGLGIWWVWPSPNRQVKRVILRTEQIFESREIEPLRPILAETFYSHDLKRDRDETMEHLIEIFEDVLSIDIRIKRIQVEIRGALASAIVSFHVSGTIKGGGVYNAVPFRGISTSARSGNPLERCRVQFVKEDDDAWHINNVELLPPAEPAVLVAP